MAKEKVPGTPAIRLLKQFKVKFVPRFYKYEDRGGTKTSARELGVDEHNVIKTLVMEDEQQQPLIVLMHGDCEVSLKHLARQLGVKQVSPCPPTKADRLTGYQTGGFLPSAPGRKCRSIWRNRSPHWITSLSMVAKGDSWWKSTRPVCLPFLSRPGSPSPYNTRWVMTTTDSLAAATTAIPRYISHGHHGRGGHGGGDADENQEPHQRHNAPGSANWKFF